MTEKQDITKPTTSVPASWDNLRQEVDRVFDRFSGGLLRPNQAFDVFDRFTEGFMPPAFRRLFPAPRAFSFEAPVIDVTEDGDAYKLTAELPGVDEHQVEVALNDGVLTIKGEKHQETNNNSENRHVAERFYGSFSRSFTLPPGVNSEGINASFNKGVLTVILPKTAQAKISERKIEIKTQ